MELSIKIWILAGFAAALNLTNIILNIVIALNLADTTVLTALRVLLFISFGLSIAALINLALYNTLFVRKLRNRSYGLDTSAWPVFGGGVTIAAVSTCVSGVTLVWLVLRQPELPAKMLQVNSMTLVGTWFGIWGVSMILQITVFALIGLWVRQVLREQSVGRLDLDFGIRLPAMEERRPETRDTNLSFQSQDNTLNSPPRTPVSHPPSTTPMSSSTKVASSTRSRFMKGSNRSSVDLPAYPAGEAMPLDHSFDGWDTSSVHREMRAVVHSSTPTRGGLETIPGSRPESPEDVLDGPFLPSSPHATSSDTPTAFGWDPMSPSRIIPSTPPSSPPNFSRPTSSSMNKPMTGIFEGYILDYNMGDKVHPLYRPNSPLPHPNATPGTIITASPLADQLITPRTLAKLRHSTTSSHWRAMPSIDRSERPSTAGSMPGSPGLGSPGPSIVDEEEELDLPPILPGFVLSAGQRSSLVGYGKRKSTKKERPRSYLSSSSRTGSLA